MEAPHQEDRQRNERSTERPRDHVGRGRHLADVELDIAHHSAERADDGRDLDEVGLHARDRGHPALDILGMAVGGDRDFQPRLCHGLPPYCFSMPDSSITVAHFLISVAMRSRISSGVLPRASMPSVAAVARRAGSDSAALTCWLRTASVSAGMPAFEARPFQLVTMYSGNPLSFAVGTSRSNGLRSSPDVAMILTWLSEITACNPA